MASNTWLNNYQASQKSSNKYTPIAPPTFGAIDRSVLDKLRTRIGQAEQETANPLGSAGAQAAIQAINIGAARRAQSERGEAKSYAAQSGQAGFGGALQQTAAEISSRQGDAVTQQSGQLATQIMEQARAEGMTLTQALTTAQNEITRIETEREQIRAEVAARNAELRQREIERQQSEALERARLAEQTRQFDVSQESERGRFDKTFGLSEREFAEQQRRASEEEERLAKQSSTDEARYKESQDRLDKQLRTEQMRYDNAKRLEERRYLEEQKRYEEEQGFNRLMQTAPLNDERALEEELSKYIPGFGRRTTGGYGSGGWLKPGEQSTKPGSSWSWRK